MSANRIQLYAIVALLVLVGVVASVYILLSAGDTEPPAGPIEGNWLLYDGTGFEVIVFDAKGNVASKPASPSFTSGSGSVVGDELRVNVEGIVGPGGEYTTSFRGTRIPDEEIEGYLPPGLTVSQVDSVYLGLFERTDLPEFVIPVAAIKLAGSFASTPSAQVATIGPTATPRPTSTPAPTPTLVPRTNCEAINVTGPRSDQEREFLAANCPARNDCVLIQGTPFRSQDERDWYLVNCIQPQSAANPAAEAPTPGCGYDGNARADRNYITVTIRRWCGGDFPQGGDGERIRATMHWSAVGAGEDQSCVAPFDNGFAFCYIPPRDALDASSVPISVDVPGRTLTGTVPGFIGLDSVAIVDSGPAETSGLTGLPTPVPDPNYPNCSYTVITRVDLSFVTITTSNRCGNQDRTAEIVTATVHWSAVDAGSDESCSIGFNTNNFAICTVPTRLTGRVNIEVPVTVSTMAGDYETSFLTVQ